MRQHPCRIRSHTWDFFLKRPELCCSHDMKLDFQQSRWDRIQIWGCSVKRAKRGQPGAVEQDLLIEWDEYRKWATGRVASMGQDITEVWKLERNGENESQVWGDDQGDGHCSSSSSFNWRTPEVGVLPLCQGCISDVMDLPWPRPRPVVLQASTTSLLTPPPPPHPPTYWWAHVLESEKLRPLSRNMFNVVHTSSLKHVCLCLCFIL